MDKWEKAWKAMNDEQRVAYNELREKRTLCRKLTVKYGDLFVKVDGTDDTILACEWVAVNNAIADIVLAQEEPKSVAEMTDEELWEEAWKRAWVRFIPGVNSWVQLAIEIHRELKEARDNAQNRT